MDQSHESQQRNKVTFARMASDFGKSRKPFVDMECHIEKMTEEFKHEIEKVRKKKVRGRERQEGQRKEKRVTTGAGDDFKAAVNDSNAVDDT